MNNVLRIQSISSSGYIARGNQSNPVPSGYGVSDLIHKPLVVATSRVRGAHLSLYDVFALDLFELVVLPV